MGGTDLVLDPHGEGIAVIGIIGIGPDPPGSLCTFSPMTSLIQWQRMLAKEGVDLSALCTYYPGSNVDTRQCLSLNHKRNFRRFSGRSPAKIG
jgi:hypothetical protein